MLVNDRRNNVKEFCFAVSCIIRAVLLGLTSNKAIALAMTHGLASKKFDQVFTCTRSYAFCLHFRPSARRLF